MRARAVAVEREVGEVQAIAALTGAIAELVTTFRRQDRPDIVSDIARQLRVIVDAAGAAGR